jgi:hypothetical protein
MDLCLRVSPYFMPTIEQWGGRTGSIGWAEWVCYESDEWAWHGSDKPRFMIAQPCNIYMRAFTCTFTQSDSDCAVGPLNRRDIAPAGLRTVGFDWMNQDDTAVVMPRCSRVGPMTRYYPSMKKLNMRRMRKAEVKGKERHGADKGCKYLSIARRYCRRHRSTL